MRAPALALAALLAACGSSMPSPEQQGALAAWTADDGVCIANAQTRAQADACRDSMRVAFCGDGGLLADSGACAHVVLSNGGRP